MLQEFLVVLWAAFWVLARYDKTIETVMTTGFLGKEKLEV